MTVCHNLISGFGAVGFENNPSYGHTASHHTPQLSSLPFKHEDVLSQTNNLGSGLARRVCLVFLFIWLAVWCLLSQPSRKHFFISRPTCYYLSADTRKSRTTQTHGMVNGCVKTWQAAGKKQLSAKTLIYRKISNRFRCWLKDKRKKCFCFVRFCT